MSTLPQATPAVPPAATPGTPMNAPAAAQAGAGGGNFPMHPSGSLYVGDLAPDVTEAILFEVFSRAGAVSSIRVCRDATTRRSLGYAYVNFHSVHDAERALDTLNFSPIKDRPCRVMWSHRDPSSRKSSKSNVFIKNLASTIDSKQLYDTFSKFGNILSCKVAIDLITGASRGFGYVHFETEESATKAIEDVNGHTIAGKAVYVGKFERRNERTTGANRFTNVYVKNIPSDWDEHRLTKEFSAFGKVTSVALRQGGEKHSGLCYGFVNFDTHEEASKAVDEAATTVKAEPALFCDRFQKRAERTALLAKQYDERRREKMEKFKNLNLYFKNLDEDVDEEKMREVFKEFGEISSLVIMKDDTGASRGFGFVCFANPDDAAKCLAEANGKVVGTKPLYINRAQRREERRMQLEHSFMAGQRMQPMAMFFPPNVPMQPQYMMQPQFRRMPPQAPMRGFPQGAYFPQAGRPGGRGGRGAAQPPGRGAAYPPTRGAGRGFRGGPQRGYGRGGEQAPGAVPQPVMMPPQELSAPMLASASPEMQKQILGERLYPLVYKENPKLAAKITGMFLEMETSEILTLLELPAELQSKIQEAMQVLESSSTQAPQQ